MEYIVNLTEAENKALLHVAVSAQEWIDNIVHERCRVAMDEIFQKECERLSESGQEISGTKESIVLAAPIKSAKEIQEEAISQIQSQQQETRALEEERIRQDELARIEDEELVKSAYENL